MTAKTGEWTQFGLLVTDDWPQRVLLYVCAPDEEPEMILNLSPPDMGQVINPMRGVYEDWQGHPDQPSPIWGSKKLRFRFQSAFKNGLHKLTRAATDSGLWYGFIDAIPLHMDNLTKELYNAWQAAQQDILIFTPQTKSWEPIGAALVVRKWGL